MSDLCFVDTIYNRRSMAKRHWKKKVPGKTALKVLKLIDRRWPATPGEIGQIIEHRRPDKTLYGKYLFHFKRLKKANLINLKHEGRTYIAWPKDLTEVEKIRGKLRAVKEILKDV